LLFGYARSLHRELPHLPPEDAAQSACHLRDLAVMALGATRDAGQIAMDAGFGDLSWFNARFKRCYGLSPRDVRARARRGD
ncbi:MAG TPA: hypothetical protein DCK97_08530, partial [Tistrella mobilis]|nr:hypothetical protein [Tistrella mobilis]